MLRRYTSAFTGSLAFHAGVIAAIVWLLSPRARLLLDAPAPRAVQVFSVAPENDSFPGLKPVDPAAGSRVRALEAGERTVSAGGSTFDVGKIAERADVLFPFVSPGVALEYFGLRPPNGAMVFVRPLRSVPGDGTANPRPALVLSAAAVQAAIDKSWARRERWTAFKTVRALTARYSPDEGQLPVVLRGYTDQNALQPYRDKEAPDPRLWAQLGIAADHVSFIGFIRQYAGEHPSTRATTELLFLLDRIAEASQDALITLLETNPDADLQLTRESNVKAFRLAVRLRGHYRAALSRRGLSSSAALARHYDGVRLAILNGILRTTPAGYRASDARVLIGTILWREGRADEAVAAWRNLSCGATDSFRDACAQLTRVLPGAPLGATVEGEIAKQIERVLKNEQGRWWDLSYERLTRFGYRFDSY